MKVIFSRSAINAKSPIQQAQTREDIAIQIVNRQCDAQTGRQQKKDAEAENDHPHAIVEDGSPQGIIPFSAVLSFFMLIHNNAFTRLGGQIKKIS
jgi:hypothetical protein